MASQTAIAGSVQSRTGSVVFLLVILFLIWLNESGKLGRILTIMRTPGAVSSPSSDSSGGFIPVQPKPGGPLTGPIGAGDGGIHSPRK